MSLECPAPDLKRYVKDCVALKDTIELLISDLEFVEIHGGTIHYAVDFSEIYAYALPTKTASEYRLFSNEPKTVADSLQRIALNRFFFTLPQRPILLVPYAIELDGFFLELRHGALDDLLEAAISAFEDAKAIVDAPEFKSISALIGQLKDTSKEPTKNQKKAFVSFLEKHAHGVLWLLELANGSPIKRLQRLFGQDRMIDLYDAIGSEPGSDSRVEDRWFKSLVARRKAKRRVEVSRTDARAVAMIERANRLLQKHNAKIILVTRSGSIHQVFETEYRKGLWDRSGGHVLRHPRTFGIPDVLEGASNAVAIQKLRSRLETIQLFLDSVAEGNQSDPSGADPDLSATLLCEIQNYWTSTEALGASLGEALSTSPSISRDVDLLEVEKIMELLKDSNALEEFVVVRIEELARELQEHHELLAWYIQSGRQLDRDSAESNLPEKQAEEERGLAIAPEGLPYVLQFSAQSAKEFLEILELLRSSQQNSWSRVLELLKKGFRGAQSDYERLLAMAYILGALNKWRFAERYCKRAIQVADEKGDVSAHEGLFFLAICHRKWQESAQRHLAAIEFLDQAHIIQKRAMGRPDFEDPRYLTEKAAHIVMLHVYYVNVADASVPAPEIGLALLLQAEEQSKQDRRLAVEIYRNRLLYCAEARTPENRDKLHEYRLKLESLQRRVEADEQKWPALVLDTIAWTDWLLGASGVTPNIDQIVTRLKTALRSPEPTVIERTRIQDHMEAVRKGERRTPPRASL
jgi:hypothetical protein